MFPMWIEQSAEEAKAVMKSFEGLNLFPERGTRKKSLPFVVQKINTKPR